ncbi:lysophospholipid acyltransferase LPCAT4-like isoform X2 [Hylaeus volcanicus]|nr:lysophospholipid acyltransferase LPCAT4-like isoform X2 [Hylaeus volcanicus]
MSWSRIESECKKRTISKAALHAFQRLDSHEYHRLTKICLSIFSILFVFPLRGLILIILCALSAIFSLFLPQIHDGNVSRRCFLLRLCVCNKIVSCFMSVLLTVMGLIIVDNFPEASRKKIPQDEIIVSNHVSILDIIYFMSRLGLPSFVSKSSVAKLPLISRFSNAMNCIYVNRDSVENRSQALESIHNRQRNISNGESLNTLILFAEGTTSNGHTILPFKNGAFSTLQKVTVVVLFYPCTYFHPAFDILDPMVYITLLVASPVPCRLYTTWIFNVSPEILPPKNSDAQCVKHFKNKVYNEALCVLQKQQTKYYGFNTTSSEFLQDLLFMSQDKWGDSLKVKKQLYDCIHNKGS